MQRMSIDEVLLSDDHISQVRVTREAVFWLASIAAEDGRTTIRCFDGSDVIDLTPEANVRSRVHEYGGGAYAVAEGAVAWVDDYNAQVWLLEDGNRLALTEAGSQFRYAGLYLVPERRCLIAVREDLEATPEPRSELVALAFDEQGPGRVLVTGADFYAGPTVHDGQLAWFQWLHPNMSWDAAEVLTCPLDAPHEITCVAASPGVSAQHPIWLGDGALAWVSDETGFWNWQVLSGDYRYQWQVPRDCSVPAWVLDAPPACAVGDDLLATVELTSGRGALALVRPSSGGVTYPLPGTAMIESVASRDQDLFVIAEWPDRAPSLVHISPTGARHEIVSSNRQLDVSVGVCRWADGPAGPVQSWFYPVPGAVEPMPMLVMTHGGPTSASYPGYDKLIQFWASRGLAVLDVNYSGSTGFGRAYRDRLRGAWGVLDVADVAAAVQEVCSAGLADPGRVAITGGSAGGYTTLQALVTTDVFAAGISRYGIGDMAALATDTHKLESRYTFSLVGPWPEAEQIYRARSPIHHLETLTTPMLILQGTEDKVVPPDQAKAMADAVRTKGLPVALVLFDGEGHGFRSLAARRGRLEAEVSFLEQVFGLEADPEVPRLTIDNLGG